MALLHCEDMRELRRARTFWCDEVMPNEIVLTGNVRICQPMHSIFWFFDDCKLQLYSFGYKISKQTYSLEIVPMFVLN